MLHGPWRFSYNLPLLVRWWMPVISFNILYFMYIQKSIQLLWAYIETVSLLGWSGLKRQCHIFLSVVCIHRLVLSPTTHMPLHLQTKKNTEVPVIHFFVCFKLPWWSQDSNTDVSPITSTPRRDKGIKEMVNQTKDGPLKQCMLITLKRIVSCRLQNGHLSRVHYYKQEHCDLYKNYLLHYTRECDVILHG